MIGDGVLKQGKEATWAVSKIRNTLEVQIRKAKTRVFSKFSDQNHPWFEVIE